MKIEKVTIMLLSRVLLLTAALMIGSSGEAFAGPIAESVKPLPPVAAAHNHTGYQYYSGHRIYLGAVPPGQLPSNRTFTITDTTGTWTTTITVTCFQMRFVSNISPAGTVSGIPTFSWSGINDPNAIYGVELDDSTGNRVWSDNAISAESVVYNGPQLIPGMTYRYLVLVNKSSTCSYQGSSFVSGSFVYQ